ncbi:EamA family transporter [Nocardioides faecalis]|uniref:EamA family transporter n=1 Tax=Nocardioides faecalis TaxID=2803858 RepID=UPI0020BFF6B1|nr:EamA family transporter [Nocardioides faecalis]
MNRREQSLAALVAAIWGVNFVVIDWGMGDVPPLVFLAVRFLAVIVPAVLLVPPPAVGWRTVAAVGTFMSLGQFGLLYVALDVGLPPGLAGLVLQAQVALTIAISAVALRERPTRAQAIGVLLGAVGLVVVGFGRGGHVALLGLLLCLGAALMWAIGNVVARTSGAGGAAGGLSMTVWSALVVPVPLLLLAVALDGPGTLSAAAAAFGWKAALSTLYTAGLASLVGYGIFNSLLARHPSSEVVPWILLVPPVAIGSAWLLLDEVPSPGELAGGVLLVAGVLVAQRGGRRVAREALSDRTRCTTAPSRPGSPVPPAPAAP